MDKDLYDKLMELALWAQEAVNNCKQFWGPGLPAHIEKLTAIRNGLDELIAIKDP